MSEQTKASPPQVSCPLCGAAAEAGHLFSKVLQWVEGEYGPWRSPLVGLKNQVASLFGADDSVGVISAAGAVYLTGVRCRACRRIVLELPDSAAAAAEPSRQAGEGSA